MDWTYGYHLSGSTVNPFTSRGGSVNGARNVQVFNRDDGSTSTERFTYEGKGTGWEIGASAEGVFAFGEGEWAGKFSSINLNVGLYSASVFWSPGEGGWMGVSFGGGLGLPGAAYEETVYKRVPDECE